ncbi:MAG TPA: hypothetical protein VEY91_06545 [Candidatus Limnocylindria bacterium]|nr:hypothetical protein [Candidatus Limnocylindria bacterium]
MRTWRRRRLPAALVVLLLAASCAPHVVRPPDLLREPRAARYLTGLIEREQRGVAVEAQVVVWAELGADRELPGAQARLVLGGPDAFRLRVSSLFGTALDVSGRGDSLTAYVPARRAGMTIDAAGESLGVRAPGGLVFRALGATWRPGEAAWRESVWNDTLLHVRWLEMEDSLAMTIGSNGLPVTASLRRPDGKGVEIHYRNWDRSSGIAWPSLVELEDRAQTVRVTCKVQSLKFAAAPDRGRLTARLPEGTTRVTLSEVRAALRRLGEF